MRKAKGGGIALVAHPDTPARAVAGVFCTYIWRSPGEWKFDFKVDGSSRELKLPAPAAPERTAGLWHHTCFEVFLRDPQDGRYLEFNFSPSGQWAAYQFEGYRAGMRELGVNKPSIIGFDPLNLAAGLSTHLRGLGLDPQTIDKLVSAAPPPSTPTDRAGYLLSAALEHATLWREINVQAGISAVIEETDGTKSYWALAHPPGKPDFHHADCFALELEPAA